MALTAADTRPTNPDEQWATTTRRLRAFVAHRVPASDADDITQDILLRILRTGRTPETVEATPAWLYTVARNAVIDHYRTRRSHAPLPVDFDEQPDDTGGDQPPAALQEAARCLRPAVAAMPEPYRSAITSVDLEGMTQVAAAKAAGISVPGMKSRVQRGRRMLADILSTWCSVYLDEHGQIATEPCVTTCACEAC